MEQQRTGETAYASNAIRRRGACGPAGRPALRGSFAVAHRVLG